MIMIHCAQKKECKKSGQPKEQLRSIIEGHPFLNKYKKVLFSALNGQYPSAEAMKHDILTAGQSAGSKGKPPSSLSRRIQNRGRALYLRRGINLNKNPQSTMVCLKQHLF